MQRKTTKQSRGINADEKRFLEWCKNQVCIVTGYHGVEVHHCAGSSAKAYVGAERVHIGHWFCIPLIQDEHSFYHSYKKNFEALHGKQNDLWLKLIESYPHEIPDNVKEAIANYGK